MKNMSFFIIATISLSIIFIMTMPYSSASSDPTSLINTNSTHSKSDTALMSPLQQFKSGIVAKDITCEQGLQLILKAEDGSPACVTLETAKKLTERGWAKESVQSVQTTSLDQCLGDYVPSGNLQTGMIPVLMMQPNSTATVCVTYQFISDWNSYPNKDVYPHGIFKTTGLVNIGSTFQVVANPTMLNLTEINNGSKSTVVYQIHSGSNSSGFYNTSIPFGNCNSYPMAIGYDPSQVNSSDFSYNMFIPCFNAIDKVDSVKIVSGMTYKEIQFR